MVNKPFKRAHTMRPLFIALVFLACLPNLLSQNISKYYTQLQQESGTLYFIKTKHRFNNKNDKSKLVFDLTHLSASDSVTLNFSYTSANMYTFNHIELVCNNTHFKASAKRLFTEPQKQQWLHRYTCNLTFKQLQEFFACAHPQITLHSNNSELLLSVPPKNWSKQSAIIDKIFSTIEINR